MKKANNKNDFLVSDLPRNRYQLFFDILKNQWRNLLLLAVIITMIFSPIILLRYFNLIMINSLVSDSNVNDNLGNQIFNYTAAYNFINFFLIVVAGILLGGVCRIYKKLAYNEGFFLGADLIQGIKENFKDFIKLFVVFGIVTSLIDTLSVNYRIENNSLYLFFEILNDGIVLPILGVSMSLCCIYADTFRAKINASCKIYFKYLPKIVLLLLILLFPLLFLLINSSIAQLLVPFIYVAIYFPIAYLIVVLVLNSIFDKGINEKNFPDLVGKGMYHDNNID